MRVESLLRRHRPPPAAVGPRHCTALSFPSVVDSPLRHHRVYGVLLVLALLGGHAAAAEPVLEGRGVVVVATGVGSTPALAGIQPCDIITAWERLPSPPANPLSASGRITGWTDWQTVVWEQTPRGTVVLTGVRDGREMSWTVPRGDWTVTVRPRLAPTAAALYDEGAALFRENRPEEATALWDQLIDQAEAAGDPETACQLGLQLSDALTDLARWEQAHMACARAAAAASQLRDPTAAAAVAMLEASAWRRQREFEPMSRSLHAILPVMEVAWGDSLRLARVLVRVSHADRMRGLASYGESERCARRSLALCEQLGPGSLETAEASFSLGLLAYWRVDHPRAVAWWEQALVTARALAPESELTANVLRWLLDAAKIRGDLEQAESYCAEALRICRHREPRGRGVAILTYSLGSILYLAGELDRAEALAEEALRLAQDLPHTPTLLADVHDLLGNVASGRYDFATGLRHHRLALELQAEATGESSLESVSRMANVANDLSELGSWSEGNALYEKARTTMLALSPDTPDIVDVLNSMGLNELQVGHPESAVERFTEALAFALAHTMRGHARISALNGIARSRLQLNDLTGAEAAGRQAVEHAQRYAPGTESETRALWTLGRVYRQQGRPALALEQYRQAVAALKAVLGKIGGSAETRTTFRSAFADLYREYLELLLEAGRPEDAFGVLELYRAQSFLEMLAMRNLTASGEIPAELEAAWKNLAREADRAQDELTELPPEADTDGRLVAARSRLGELQSERNQLLQEIRAASPRLASLRRPEPLDATATRAALDPGTLLLSYSVGADGSTLFALSPDEGLAVFPLEPGRGALEEQVSDFRRLITRGAVQEGSPSALTDRGRRLYDLLVRPAEAQVERCQRLLILPDGPLHSLPFAALVRALPDGSTQYLVERRPLHLAMSATVFAELTRARPSNDARFSGAVTIFGDPDYPVVADATGFGDPRVRELLSRGGVLTPLPSTRVEAEAIAGIFRDRARLYLEKEATEEQAKAQDRTSRILHFACHGVLDPQLPLDSSLALTIPVDPGERQENGLLQAWEIMERMRLDADLVTLSACNTALGQEAGGEGLIGLTRAFQHAGAHSVLASLWSVADASTAALMSRFYENLEQGADRTEALRKAQRDLIRGPVSLPGDADPGRQVDATHPFFWAAFQLFGDWR